MPEWPEMDTYRRLLSPLLNGRVILRAVVNREKTINEAPEAFAEALEGKRILYVERRGKHLLFHLDDGYRLLLHLMLGGYLHYGEHAPKEDEHYQVILTFDDGNRLFFGGLRLGFLHRLSAKAALEQLKELGPDPFDARLTAAAFKDRLSKRRGKLKSALTDQKFLSGIGNCYGDEICFDAEIRPDAAIPELTEETKDRLFASMRSVLTEAAANGGYMDRPLTPTDTFTGGHDDKVKIYDREGEACPRCGGTIRLETLSGRKMFYCPDCQRNA
ncbi:bifunctional DNA-formamidopyrimidine glycosylase/DNA-(apurinic or apyrimidinic site) lyase [Cohnella sp. REN36]|uniref:bifunctional DNA-formamidopyrimidine glycosylase/DNA-(apurinic or apyrimidinic site) lyase n=1 Tax=Cohnella sp. REN36 TaxID=2887347 RepID=UPI001D135239|nr:bifunctional DNA-formamidopyrimidine glycosylase/DNA-(apurinic or apyrimidinic site) lyase [Cohnella sp. REN36]MCC3373184.1 bifunctional DNA-formamidopyrimidine glycosylase/DNA-(apurinic or apyrimidinic site) lyase [Cohnella sp. REN36]